MVKSFFFRTQFLIFAQCVIGALRPKLQGKIIHGKFEGEKQRQFIMFSHIWWHANESQSLCCAVRKEKKFIFKYFFFSRDRICTQKSNERRNDAFLRAIPALSEKLPKWHFLIHACNSNFFCAKLLLLKCFESATKWLYPKNVSGSVQVLKTLDKSG